MSIWQTLGIEPTHDIAAIKKAYAGKLKLHHPEDDPEGYQRLREAYDQAVKLAKQQNKRAMGRSERFAEQAEDRTEANEESEKAEAGNDEGNDEDDDDYEYEDDEMSDADDDDDEEDDRSSFYSRFVTWREGAEEPDTAASRIDRFMEQVERLYEDYPSRIDTDQWLELMNSDVIWNVQLKNTVSERMLEFLEKHYFIPKPVWTLLEQTFHWQEMYPDDFPDRYLKVHTYAYAESYEASRMGYSVLLNAGDIPHDVYLRHREAAWLALMNGDMSTAAIQLKQALDLFDGDPDLLRLYLQCQWLGGDMDKVFAISGQLIQLSPDQADGYLYRARVWMQQGKWNDAMDDLLQVLPHQPNHMLALSLAGNCWTKLGDYERAREAFQRIVDNDPNDIEAVFTLAELSAHSLKQMKQDGAKDNGLSRSRLETETGKTALSVRLKRSLFYLLTRKWFSLIMIVALHFWIAGSFVKHTGESPISYLADDFKPAKIVDVATPGDLELLPPDATAVRVQITNASYLGIHQVQIKDESGKEKTVYMPAAEAEKQDLLTSGSGYLNIGYLDQIPILVVGNYKQAKEIYDNKKIQIEGIVRPIHSAELKAEIEKWKKQGANSTKQLSGKYIDSIHDPSRLPRAPLPLRIYFYVFLLSCYYVSVCRELVRTVKFLRYT